MKRPITQRAKTTDERLGAVHLSLAQATGQLSLMLTTGKRQPGQLAAITTNVKAALDELAALRQELASVQR